MRTTAEIVARIKAQSDTDIFGFGTSLLLSYVPYEDAKPFLRPDSEFTAETWTSNGWPAPATKEALTKELAEYMMFAWGKVQDHRGLSANRSTIKLLEWVWLLGDDATVAKVEATEYAQYGAPKLKVICEAFGLPIPDAAGVQRMISGESCKPDCEEGCSQ